MKESAIILPILIVAFLITGMGLYAWVQQAKDENNQTSTTQSPTPTPTPSSTPATSLTEEPQAEPTSQTVQLFLVGLEDSSGTVFGCGDALVGVSQQLTTATPLTDSIKALIAIKDEYYGESGLYNALWQSELSLASASITDGVATIALTGELQMSGTCDNPRIREQLTATATQFESVNSVEITLNGQSLDQVLSTL